MYTPDNWVIIKITNDDEVFYKVLAGWSGGYLDGSSWRLNSGITKVIEEDHYIYFYGESGSEYKCNKQSEQLRMNCAHVYTDMQTQFPNKLGLISYNDFKKEFNQD